MLREMILAVSNWLHLIATVIWIGGITFILFIAIPAGKQLLGAEAGKLTGEISRRFAPLANLSIFMVIVTGIVLTGFNKQLWESWRFENSRTLFLIVKHALVLGMVVVHFYRGLVLTPKIARTESITEKVSLQKISLSFVKINFCLGLLALLFSGIIFKRP